MMIEELFEKFKMLTMDEREELSEVLGLVCFHFFFSKKLLTLWKDGSVVLNFATMDFIQFKRIERFVERKLAGRVIPVVERPKPEAVGMSGLGSPPHSLTM
jgi:hypothetical protein